jgi:DNA-binding XRE family transcriptional regulator
MLKQKLQQKRKERGFSQEDMAHKLGMEQSQYSRRENGQITISTKEWTSMAKLLDTTIEDIYEPQDGVYIIKYKNANGEYAGSHNHFQNQNDHSLDIQKKYIAKLEEENAQLRAEIELLKK